jgi:peptidoglycan/xylan/chitin deacetylase (PgdA/CDA1 family)
MLKCVRMSKLLSVAVVASAMFAGAALAGPNCTNNPDVLGTSRTITVRPSDFPRIGTEQYAESLRLKNREVVLTFDDGPVRGNSAKVLDALAAECVKATFFMMGLNVAEAPSLVRRAFDEGHSVGTHTFSHIHLNEVPFEKAKQDIELGIEAVTEALGKGR